MSIYTRAFADRTTAVTIKSSDHIDFPSAKSHQISWTKNGGTTGTLAVQVKPAGTDRFENLTVGGVAVSLSLAADGTFGPFDGMFSEIKVTPAGFDGTNFSISFSGWGE